MDYRDMLGFSKKQPKKKVEKKVAPKPTVPPITELLKEEFAKGAASCRMDMEEINIEVPNRMLPLQRLHRFLNEKTHR